MLYSYNRNEMHSLSTQAHQFPVKWADKNINVFDY